MQTGNNCLEVSYLIPTHLTEIGGCKLLQSDFTCATATVIFSGYEFESDADEPSEGFSGQEPLLEAPGYETDPAHSLGEGQCHDPSSYAGGFSPYHPQKHATYEVSQPGLEPESSFQYSTPQYPGPSGYSLQSPEEGPYAAAGGSFDHAGGARAWAGSGDQEGEKKKGKRAQTCRLCANHGLVVEMKGHKLYCNYQKPHDCAKCEITLQRRYYTAAQQRITRTQQLQLQDGQEPAQAGHPPLPANPREFPRLPELLQDCDNIIDESLFARINEVVRPRSHHPQ